MTKHVEDLAAEHAVKVTWKRIAWHQAEAYVGSSRSSVVIPEIRRPGDYLAALHELGHCADPLARRLRKRGDRYNAVVCEGAAWAWAAANMRFRKHVPTAEWNRVAGRGFRSYLSVPWRRLDR